MKRELKKHIKEDELVTGIARATAWARLHVNELKVTGAIVAVVAVGAAALNYFQGTRNREAEKLFGEALQTFQAPVGPAPAPAEEAPTAGPRFATDAEKHKKAVADFDALASKYPSLPAGKRARYYAALSRAELGELDAAEKTLTELATYRDADSIEPGLARLALADLQGRRGQPEKAAEAYRKLLDDETSGLPKDYVLMRLASALEDAKRAAEAEASYKRLANDYPQSVFAGEARRRADWLSGTEG
jgi:tetratricopeptide (TPR) repeat protein